MVRFSGKGFTRSGISLGAGRRSDYKPGAMTRAAIEVCIKIFIVALIVVFGWTVMRVLGMMGWM